MNPPIKLLLSPGPVAVHPNVYESLHLTPTLHHRTQYFTELINRTSKLLFEVFEIPSDFHIAYFGSSGTGAVEAMLSITKSLSRKEVLILINGHFGERIISMVENMHIKYSIFRFDAVEEFDLDQFDSLLKRNKNIGTVIAVHMETSVGQFNKFMPEVSEICRNNGTFLFLDMVSSLAGESFSFKDIMPDVAVSVSGKAIGAFSGISFILIRQEVIESIKTELIGCHYFNIMKYLSNKTDLGVVLPFTPPIILFPPFLQALSEIKHEGLSTKIERHVSCLTILKNFFLELGFSPVPVSCPSETTTTFTYSVNDTPFYRYIENEISQRNVFIYQNDIYHLPFNMFQISTMGWIHPYQVSHFSNELSVALRVNKSVCKSL